MLKQILTVICFSIFVMSFGAVSEEDYKEEKLQEKEYCDNVAKGYWPDYMKMYKKVCNIKEVDEQENYSKLELLALSNLNTQL